jgi:hypothetical protein
MGEDEGRGVGGLKLGCGKGGATLPALSMFRKPKTIDSSSGNSGDEGGIVGVNVAFEGLSSAFDVRSWKGVLNFRSTSTFSGLLMTMRLIECSSNRAAFGLRDFVPESNSFDNRDVLPGT